MERPHRLNYRPDIQGLRAVAILLVALGHAGVPFVDGGFVGVDVFFVISGYLITGILVRNHLDRRMFADFYARRLKRLLPALAFMITCVLLASYLLLTTTEIHEQTRSLPFAATWMSNFYFAFTEVDYFAELQGKDLFLHTWSLGVEEQFNLIWPLLIFSVYASARHLGYKKNQVLMVAICIIGLISLTLAVRLGTGPHASASYYLLHTRFMEFLIGAAVYLFHMRAAGGGLSKYIFSRFRTDPQTAGIILIVGSAVLFGKHMPYPSGYALLPTLGAALVIASPPQVARGFANRLLGNRCMIWIGDTSYSWYLWHWPVFMIGEAYGARTMMGGSIMLLLLSLALARLSFHLVELPFWKGRFSGMLPTRVFLLAIIAMGTPVALNNVLSSLIATHQPQAAQSASAAQLARQDTPWIYAQICDTSFRSSELTPCSRGNPEADKVAVIAGDSIGVQWVSMLSDLLDESKWHIVVLTKSSCPMVDQDVYLRDHTVFEKCRVWRDQMLEYVASLQPDVVFLGSASSYGFSRRQWIEGSESVFKRIESAAGKIIVIAGTPALSFDGPACLQRAESRTGDSIDPKACSEPASVARSDDVASYLQNAVSLHATAQLLNLNDLVCPNGICQAQTDDGVVVFRDTQHLTDSFVRSRANAIRQKIQKLNLLPVARGFPHSNSDASAQ